MAVAADHNVIPVTETFIADTETPVSAFLKLRGDGPAFLLESAEQGQRVGRWSFIGFEPRKVVRWSLADGGDPYAIAAAEVAEHRQAPLADGAAVHRRRGRLLRLRLRARGRAARRAQPRRARPARHGADALRRAGGVRPPQAHGHDPRQRLPRRAERAATRPLAEAGEARARERIAEVRERLAGAAAAPRAARRAPRAAVRAQHAARGVRGDGRPDRRVRARRRRLPGRAVSQRWSAPSPVEPFSIYRGLRAVNPSPYMYFLDFEDFQIVGASPEPLRHGLRPPRLDAPDRRHAPARRRRRRGHRDRRRPAGRREGARRARDARRPRPQRPRARLRVRHASRSRRSWPSRPTRT